MLTVDARSFVSKRETHAALRAALSGVSGGDNYYGSNLDALHDCLTSVGEETVLRIVNWSFAVHSLGDYAEALWRVLEDSVEENPNLKIIIE